MTFANPAAFWGLLLAVPVVAVYLIRNRPSTSQVSTLLFWEQVSDEQAATSFLRQLRNPGSLLLQLLILLLMVLALSRPAFRSFAQQASRQILVIDNSASMQAVDESGSSRFELAIAEAGSLINAASPDTETMILVSCPSAKVVCPATASRALAQIRLNEIKPTDCVGQLQDAVQFAKTATGSDTDAAVVTITDGNETSNASVNDDSDEATTIIVGNDVDNVGISGFQARRASSDPTLWQLYFEVSNFSGSQQDLNLEIRLNDTLIDILPLHLTSGQSQQRIVSKSSSDGGLITARLRASDLKDTWTDGLALDDSATTSLSARSPYDVTLVTSGNWFLQQVLAANPLVQLTVISPADFATSAKREGSIVVFDGRIPESWPPADSDTQIKAIAVAPKSSCRLWTVNGTIDETFVGDYQADHSLIEYVQLEDIAINSATDLTVAENANVIAEAIEGQPLLATFSDNADRIILLAIDLDRSDLPLRTSFPILLTNALNWLSDAQPRLLPQANTNDQANIRVVVDSTANGLSDFWVLTDPGGQTSRVAAIDGIVRLGRLTSVGVYSLNSTAGAAAKAAPVTVPCNLVSRQESRLQQAGASEESSRLASRSSMTSFGNLQNWLLAILMVIVVAECWMWHRRVIE